LLGSHISLVVSMHVLFCFLLHVLLFTAHIASMLALPAVAMCSARTADGLTALIDEINQTGMRADVAAWVSNVTQPTKLHPHRAAIVRSADGKVTVLTPNAKDATPRPVWWVFTGMGAHWPRMAQELTVFPTYQRVLARCDFALLPHQVSLAPILASAAAGIYEDDIGNASVALVFVQVVLIELLREAGVPMEGCLGHSVGELAAGYASGSLSLEQTMLLALFRAKALKLSGCPVGKMIATGLPWVRFRTCVSPVDEGRVCCAVCFIYFFFAPVMHVGVQFITPPSVSLWVCFSLGLSLSPHVLVGLTGRPVAHWNLARLPQCNQQCHRVGLS
jgi:hypothetical protein